MQQSALLSVSDKSGLVDFTRQLRQAKIHLIASGGTAQVLQEAGLEVQTVENLTGFPEILGGRVKTLHPAIHAGILARRNAEHLEELATHQLTTIDLVVVNLYPFQKTVARPEVTLSEAVEQIDIGGVALLRAAAKNHESVLVVCDPADYAVVAEAITAGKVDARLRISLALKAFQQTAAYDRAIATYLTAALQATESAENSTQPQEKTVDLPQHIHLDLSRVQQNRYGENPHQQGGFYRWAGMDNLPFEQLHGRQISYNNWLDLDSSWRAAQDFPMPTVAIVKHGNPCGLASGETVLEAFSKALQCDPVSAFGSVISLNRTVDLALAQALSNQFVEVIAAPAYSREALDHLTRKPKRIILKAKEEVLANPISIRSVLGGYLVQTNDYSLEDMQVENWRIVSQRQPSEQQLTDLLFAWRTARHVKSNAIVFAHQQATVGIGAGQMSRVDSVMLAGYKAGEKAEGAVMASDAFFPFADAIEAAAAYGIKAVVQPGGSRRDSEVIEAVNRLNLVMALTGTRHFRH